MGIVGKMIYPNLEMEQNPIPAFWGQCFEEGLFAMLTGLMRVG